jgi:hypothetical protein
MAVGQLDKIEVGVVCLPGTGSSRSRRLKEAGEENYPATGCGQFQECSAIDHHVLLG